MSELLILISAYGPQALEKIASLRHESCQNVRYIVGWQKYDVRRIPSFLKQRKDFTILYEETVGLCNNRNALLKYAWDEIVTVTDYDVYALIADDDLEYTANNLNAAFKAFETNPRSHILTFQYASALFPKKYPSKSFDIRRPPKGYFVTSMELGFNLSLFKQSFENLEPIYFHPAFGVNGTLFGCGEEDLLLSRLLRKDCTGTYIPVEICSNTESTTSERISDTEAFIETKGAVMGYLKPYTWPLRMWTHAWRARKNVSLFKYCLWWLNGRGKARKARVFKNY